MRPGTEKVAIAASVRPFELGWIEMFGRSNVYVDVVEW
jgi:hypothetical protein